MIGVERKIKKRWPLVHRQIVEKGWRVDGTTGKGHARIVHEPTGQKMSIPATPSDTRGQRNALAYMKRIDHASK